MKRTILFILFPLLGVIAAVLRHAQRVNAFTPDGLLIPGRGSTTALIVLSVLVFAGALLYGCFCRPRPAEGLPPRLASSGGAALAVASGFLLLIGGVLTAMENMVYPRHIAWVVLAVLLVLSGALLIVCVVQLRRDPRSNAGALLLLPDFVCCVWLVLLYQRNAADPVLMDYVFQLFAVVCILLALYFLTGQAYRLRRSRQTVFFCLLAGYFSLLSLGDGGPLSMLVLLVAFALYLLLHGALLSLGERSHHG